MKVVIAPNTFKESLPASEAAAAIAEGILSVLPHATLDLCPMADGGDGTVPAMVAATGGRLVTADVFGPLGEFRRAHFGLLGTSLASPLPGELGLAAAQGAASGEGDSLEHAGVAVIEMAAASGLALTPTDRRDPLRTTTFGTGQLILAALEAGADYIGVGPIFKSATKHRDFVLGPAGLKDIRAAVPLPTVAIAGITLENVDQVLSAAPTAVAVCRDIIAADDPQARAAAIRQAVLAKFKELP